MKLKEKPDLVKDLLFTSNIRLMFFKNLLQYFIGAGFYLLTFGQINLLTLFLGCASFLITYSSIYIFNDLMDSKKDSLDAEKLKYKPVANKSLSFEKAVSLMFFLIITGFFLSFGLNSFFTIFLALSLFGNFLHSSVYTRFKDKSLVKIYLGKGLADFSKPALGWFTQTSLFANFPLSIVLMMASLQTFGYYYISKKRLILEGKKLYVKEFKNAMLAVFLIVFFIFLSIIYTTLKFALISMLVMIGFYSIILIAINKKVDSFQINKVYKLTSKFVLLALLITLLFYLRDFPNGIDSSINHYTDVLRVSINNHVINVFEIIKAKVNFNGNISSIINNVSNMTIVSAQ